MNCFARGGRWRWLAPTLAVALLAAACASPASPRGDGPLPPTGAPPVLLAATPTATASADLAFAGDLYSQLAASPGNVVVSPSSIATVLQMILLGAKGATADEIRSVLHLNGVSDDQVVADAAAARTSLAALTDEATTGEVLQSDRMWVAQHFSLNSSFTASLQAGWASPLTALNFGGDPEGSRETINSAVSDETKGLIPQLLSPGTIAADTVLVLTDAVYLKADWVSPFKAALTAPGPFTPDGAATEQVPMMHQTGSFAYAAGPGYQAVQLPYAGGRLSMTILLPSGPIAPLEAKIARSGLGPLLAGLSPAAVALTLPKFTVHESTELTRALGALGMGDAFAGGDFSGIASGRIQLSAVVHQAVVAVDEAGTTAAAATAGIFADSALAAPPPGLVTFTVDHPFLFVISDSVTGLSLFLGRVNDPTA